MGVELNLELWLMWTNVNRGDLGGVLGSFYLSFSQEGFFLLLQIYNCDFSFEPS